ncbi:MAG: AAA family ATPase [Dechloromonas sp.]|nr:AAA family ATPase [Dechloromonas sp.]
MNYAPSGPTGTYSELVLKTMPPRAPRHQLARPRLSLGDEQFVDRPVIVVQAPPGFGKTSLLGQWRREYLARGAAVAWVTADGGDDLQRFLHCLVQAVRFGCGRPGFGRLLLETLGTKPGELDGVTAWLAEVAQTSLDMVLIVDEAERLSSGNLAALIYLLHNLTPNLHVVIGTRGGIDAAIADLVDYGDALSLGAEALRFRLDETMSLARSRFGEKVDADTVARVHELTEGWPLGLQILMASVEKGGDLRLGIAAMAGGEPGGGFVGGLLANLARDDADFLVRISVVDVLHPDLAVALAGAAAAAEQLARLIRDTPVFVVGEGSEWVRLHNLVRDALRRKVADLPVEERLELHRRAMRWLADHGMIQEAARQAHEAGEHSVAYDLAENCLYEAVTQGHQETVLRWLELLPATELRKRPKLRLAAAWALALSERHGEAEALIKDILENPDGDAALRYECALIASGAAYYADDPDRYIELLKPWLAGPPPDRDPRLLQMHANRQAAMAILTGDPARARRCLQAVPHDTSDKSYRYGARWGSFITGLSYLWEGQGVLAEDVLRPALASADAELGRRHPLACMIASLLAAATFERDRVDDAAELLANRLDVLERVGTPDTALLGYRTAARIANAKGVEHRALDLLEVMNAVGVARELPRLCVASLGEQVRMHAGRFRSETCRALVQQIDEIVAEHSPGKGPIWRAAVELMQRLAHAHALIAAQEWAAAAEALAPSLTLVETAKLGRWRIETMGLRALALQRSGQDGRPLLLEAMNLAQTFSLSRVFVDAHPALADWVRRTSEEDGGQRIDMARTARPIPQRSTTPPRAIPSMVLTPKEREVLEYLARNLSNKEIAQAMAVGEETIKWHLKNLFGKLDAGTRKHVVRRAQLLGLLEGVD